MRFKKLLSIILATVILVVTVPNRNVLGQNGSDENNDQSTSDIYIEYLLLTTASIGAALSPPPVAIVLGIIMIGSDVFDQR